METERTEERMIFTFPQFCRLSAEYKVNIRSIFRPPSAPAYYARVRSKLDNKTRFYLSLDQTKERWIGFAPGEEVDTEIQELFAGVA